LNLRRSPSATTRAKVFAHANAAKRAFDEIEREKMDGWSRTKTEEERANDDLGRKAEQRYRETADRFEKDNEFEHSR